jgi:hypothetical protein
MNKGSSRPFVLFFMKAINKSKHHKLVTSIEQLQQLLAWYHDRSASELVDALSVQKDRLIALQKNYHLLLDRLDMISDEYDNVRTQIKTREVARHLKNLKSKISVDTPEYELFVASVDHLRAS